MLKLFNLSYSIKKNSSDSLELATPLGIISVEVFMNGKKISKTAPQFSGELSSNSFLTGWIFKEIQIELLKTFINRSLPTGMNISKCVAFVWKFKNFSKNINLKFCCRLLHTPVSLEGEPESGEGLIAQSWGHETARITIGTEDENDLHSRAEKQIGLPLRFAQENLLIPEIINYLKDGIEIKFPPFLENEEGQVQFIIAWAEGKGCNDSSTWFAVDLPPQEILNQACHSQPKN